MTGRRVLADRSAYGSFERCHGLALAAGHFYSDWIFRRAVRVDVEHEAGGAGVVPFGGGQLLDRWWRWCLALWRFGSGSSLGGWVLFLGFAAKPAGPRAAGQQGEA